MPREKYEGTMLKRSEDDGSLTIGILDSFADDEFVPVMHANAGGMEGLTSVNTDNLKELMKRNNDRLQDAVKMCKECKRLAKNGNISTLSTQLWKLDRLLQRLHASYWDSTAMSSTLFISLNAFMDYFNEDKEND